MNALAKTSLMLLSLLGACSEWSDDPPAPTSSTPTRPFDIGVDPLVSGCGNRPIISLTFDDGLDKHESDVRDGYMDISWHAENTLLADSASGARATPLYATFYVNRSRIQHSSAAEEASSTGITSARLRRIEALGHEIGGHTAHHVDLPTQVAESTAETEREICWDRNELSGILKENSKTETFRIFSFAYPFGAHRTEGHYWTILDIVGRDPERCGHYESARVVGGVADSDDCRDADPETPCLWGEVLSVTKPTLPLDRRFAIRAPSSIRFDTPLDFEPAPDGDYDDPEEYETRAHTIKGWVANAIENACPEVEPDAGFPEEAAEFRWWVPLIFHRICKSSGCDPVRDEYGIKDDDFVSLIGWLRGLVDAGFIEVKTVHETVAELSEPGEIQAPPPRSTRAVVENAGMNDCDDAGDCDSKDNFPDGYRVGQSAKVETFDDEGNSVARMTVPKNKRGEFHINLDMNYAALRVTAPEREGTTRTYRVSFRHRLASGEPPSEAFKFAADLRAEFLADSTGPLGGVPDQRYDAFWSSALATRDYDGMIEQTLTPSECWRRAEAYVHVPYNATEGKRKDAMSFGVATNVVDRKGDLAIDLDDFDYCVCGGVVVDSVKACQPACRTTIPEAECE